jgi:hypothetical protein
LLESMRIGSPQARASNNRSVRARVVRRECCPRNPPRLMPPRSKESPMKNFHLPLPEET